MTQPIPTPDPRTSEAEMKPSEALRKARELITPDGAWTQNAFCRDASGQEHAVGWYEGAVCWCAYGALEHVSHDHYGGKLDDWLIRVVEQDLSVFNDTHCHAEILDAFRRAEQLALSKGH